jgi:hypothetical protein
MNTEELTEPVDNTKEETTEKPKLKPEEEKELISKYVRRGKKAVSAMGDLHRDWKMIDLFDRGRQWDMVNLPVWLPKPITNLIRYVRTTKRANLALNVPQATLTPLTPIDDGFVKLLQKAYEHVWDEEKVPLTIRRCVDRSLLQGTSIAYVYVEENVRGKYFGEGHEHNQLYKYDVKVKRINNGNFFIDPDAYTINEAKFIDITENRSFSDVKNDPMFKEYAGDKLAKLKYADLQRDSNATGDIFDRDILQQNTSNDNATGDELCTVHIHWERFRNSDGEWQVDCSYFLWNTDFLLYRVEGTHVNKYPFVVLYDEEEENSFWGSSTAMDILENQKIINKADQAASIIATMNQNPQKVVLRESGINAAEMSRTGTLPGKVWTSNVDPRIAVQSIQPPDIPKGLFEMGDRMKADVKDMTGITEAYTGQSVGSLTTSSGVDSLIERSSIRDKDKSVQIDAFVEELSELIIQFIICYWKEPRPIMTRQQNGNAQYETWIPVDDKVSKNLEYRLRSDVFAKAPMTQASKRSQADKLMQMQGQFQYDPPIITPEEWISMQDFDTKEDILSRMQRDRQAKQAQEGKNIQQSIMQLVKQAEMLRGKGLTEQQVDQQIQPMVQQILQTTFSAGASQTAEQMGMASAPSPSGGQSGNMSQTASANMNSGM